MDIAIFIGGSIKNGLDSPTPGESRWAQNLAKMLSKHGHSVDCICNDMKDRPSWGNATLWPNVFLFPLINTAKEYDICLYTPWEHTFTRNRQWESCRTLPLRAKWYVHCTFSWGDSIRTDHDCYNHKHVLAYPYIQENNQFSSDKSINPYPTFPLPIPIYDTFSPINISERKDILWSTKDVFHPDWGKNEGYVDGNPNHHVPRIGLATLKCVKKLSEKHFFDVHFLSTQYFDPEQSNISRELDVIGLANTIPNSRFYNLLPQKELFNIMKKSRITAVVSGLLGSFGDSIAMGSVPLCYSGHIYRAAAEKHNLKLQVFDATEEQIYDCMERLYEDDDFYLKVIKDYREEMRYYSYDMSYEYFKTMVNDLGIGDRL